MSFLDILQGRLDGVVVVSHRWVSPHDPDEGRGGGTSTGQQLRALRAFLWEREWVKFLWFDFGSLPQKVKNPDNQILKELNLAQALYFRKALKLVNLLYLSATVVILLDADYSRRFWCLYETFLGTHLFFWR